MPKTQGNKLTRGTRLKKAVPKPKAKALAKRRPLVKDKFGSKPKVRGTAPRARGTVRKREV
jgi:hypothetical protein